MKILATLVLPLALAACATVPSEAPTADAASARKPDVATAMADPKYVCTREATTGSNMVIRKCRLIEDVEARRELDRDAAERIHTQPHDVGRKGG